MDTTLKPLLILGIALLLSISFLLLGLATDFKKTYTVLKTHTRKRMDEFDKITVKKGIFSGIFEAIELKIEKSNIRLYVRYNVLIHMAFCILFIISTFLFVHKHLSLITAISFSFVIGLLPFVILQIITDVFEKREKRNAVNFLIIFKNFIKSSSKGDVFEAFENIILYVSEPLKGYIKSMLFEYAHKINPIMCLDGLKEKLGTQELKLFIENLKISYIQGGDILALTNTFINELENLDEDDEKQNTEDRILNYGIYVLLVFNFLIIYMLINSSYKREILNTSWGQLVFVLDMIICIYVIILSLRKT